MTVIGTMNFLMYRLIYVSTSAVLWGNQIEVSPTIITGAAAGTVISGTPACSGVCALSSSVFPPQTPGVGGSANGESYYTTATTSGGAAFAYAGWTLSFKPPNVTTPATLNTTNGLAVRCDNAVPGRGPGCVVPHVTGRITYSQAVYPTFGAHLSAAQASGLPGATVPLHRLTDSALQAANRTESCKTGAVIPRPSGMSCDEYPFASSYEGAFTGGGSGRTFAGCSVTYYPTGVTGPTGFSICMINATENSSAGSQLNSVLYSPYRIIDGDPFYVSVA
ncbi:hypothetical protein IM660_18160 [Ruania alkalisoli]|uniref:Deoxyribonuclease NucA/NucB domain-containing protein n=1 Tax=Ruania alkalisoli TaxID=2779775 RepID=A0A7M1SSF0_9MICO|nr:hypothetical protein [Ruania alkalisoli]QOR70489.1 hypothetical protein IM660_18160 [Ruania alkalisoli]